MLRTLRDPKSGEVLDHGLVIFFPEGESFTGENIVEYQIHGSIATVQAVLSALQATGLGRLAEPGEFTRRALENDRLDLSQVEALSDLIDAETEAQRRQALRIFEGVLAQKVAEWRDTLLWAMAQITVSIDFADEDVPEDVRAEVSYRLEQLVEVFDAELTGAAAARRVRSGVDVAIVGEPNIGKSTLLNALAGRDVAITSEIAGTTRDVIEARLDVAGCVVTFLDTAGLRASDDQIERIGVERAQTRAAAAWMRVFLVTGEQDVAGLGVSVMPGDVVVLGKGDLLGEGQGATVSGKTGAGVDALLGQVAARLQEDTADASLLIRARQEDALTAARSALVDAVGWLRGGEDGIDLAAEDVRRAVRALDVLVGRIDVEDVLGEIFSRFCLGK